MAGFTFPYGRNRLRISSTKKYEADRKTKMKLHAFRMIRDKSAG